MFDGEIVEKNPLNINLDLKTFFSPRQSPRQSP